MHNVVSKILLIFVVILVGLFAYKTVRTDKPVTATVAIDDVNKEQPDSNKQTDVSEIQDIVKDYLLNNPEIIIQSIEKLQQRRSEELQAKSIEYIKNNKNVIESSDSSPILGNSDADIVLVVFYDYNCKYCKKGNEVIEQLMNVDQNVKVILKAFPILGESSSYASKVALSVWKISPKKFKPFHDSLMNMQTITNEAVDKWLTENGLDAKAIDEEANKDYIKDMIEKNNQVAMNLRIQGVPAYIINGKLIAGMISLEQLQQVIADIRTETK